MARSATRQDQEQEMVLQSRWSRLWEPFWALPMTICIVAGILGVLLPNVDEALSEHVPYVFEGGPEGARSLLATIASAMISVTGVVFSITVVTLQLASSQFTPRILGTFLASRITQTTLGIFAASFIYALAVLRAVRGTTDADGQFVPQTAVTLAFAFVIGSVVMFLAFINHITTSIQVRQIVTNLGAETVDTVRAQYPDEPHEGPGWLPDGGVPSMVVTATKRHGYLTQLNRGALVRLASDLDVVLEVLVPVGQFVVDGAPLARVWGADSLDDDEEGTLRKATTLETERAPHQDPAYGIRRLVDIAERALSPGINDPTTAVQVLNELHLILRVLVQRADPTPVACDDDDTVRVVHRPQTVSELIALAVEEILHYGEDSLRIPRTVVTLLHDLLTVTRPEHRQAIERWVTVSDSRGAEAHAS